MAAVCIKMTDTYQPPGFQISKRKKKKNPNRTECLKCFLSYKKRLFPVELLQQVLLDPVNDENGVDPTKRSHCPAKLKLPTRPSETSGQNGENSQISQSLVSTVNSVIASVCLPSLLRRCPEVAPSELSSPCLLFCLLDCSLQ